MRQVAASAKRDVADYVTQQLPELGTVECERVLKQLVELTDEDQLSALKDVEVRDVKVNGDRATAEAVGATETAQLRKIDGDWKVSELKFPGADAGGGATGGSGEEPSPTEEPPAEGEGGSADVARIKGRLEGAGYAVQTEEVTDEPSPDGALSVQLGGGAKMTVYIFSSFSDAAKSEVQFDPVVKENPSQIRVQTEGTHVYVGTIEEPAELPVDKFRKAIRAAEG